MKCWCTMPTPAAIASAVVQPVTSRSAPVPLGATSSVPASSPYMPARMRMSVDLPAPFSPDQRVDLAGRDLERRIAVGDDGAEGLADAGEAESERGGHER